jgi:hypothetical protein
MSISFVVRVALAMALALSATAALAVDVGQIKTVKGEVYIERGKLRIPATVGTAVQATDVVHTGKTGSTGITFIDNSRMALGPGSVLAIDRFEFNQTTHEGKFDSTLRRGTLSAVSGKVAHHSPDAMTVKTRSTILAVRGTEFLVSTK